jgi:uncharacterized lipoprotein YbaY/heat shock protein HslJ
MNRCTRPGTWFLLAAFLSMAGVPAATPARADGRITGTATYRERVALAPDAEFEASLLDVSRADARAEVIATVRKANPGQVPIAFEIVYDPDKVRPDGSYVVRALVYEHGRPRFTSDQSYPALTRGAGTTVSILMRSNAGNTTTGPATGKEGADTGLGSLPASFAGLLPCADCAGIRYLIQLLPGAAYMQRTTYLRDGHDDSSYQLGTWSRSSDGRTLILSGGTEGPAYWGVEDRKTLRKLDAVGKPIESKLPYKLIRSATLEAMEPRLRMAGSFRYQADAARFRDCATGLEWPVAMSDDYRSLESAYTTERSAPGAELLVSLQGRLEARSRMEGAGSQPTLVVEKFLRAMPGRTCEDRHARAELANTRWRPVRIGDRAVNVSADQHEPWIELDPASKRVVGSGGCNRIGGSFEAGNGTLRFGPLISTRMICPSMGNETAFFKALDATRRYRMLGRMLELLDGRGNLLARLEERNLR